MAELPRVTVLMAVRNGLPYLPAAVRSVLAQTFADFELLIVDDGSTDDTAAQVRAYRDARIRLVRHDTRLGQTCSLNRGLGLARGAYIARLDADDVCLPDRLRQQVRFLDAHDEVAVLGTWMYEMDARGRHLRRFGEVLEDYGTWVARLLLGGCPVYHSSSMFRREAVAQCGGYDERFRIGQDYDLWIRLAMRRYRAQVLPEALTRYRWHAGQQSTVDRADHQQELCLAHQRMVDALCPRGRARQVARMLRADDRFWGDCGSKAAVGEAVRALETTLVSLRETLRLTSAEDRRVRSLVSRRIGLGLSLAPRLLAWPSWAFYPGVALLSPLLIPHVHGACSGANRWQRRWRARVAGALHGAPLESEIADGLRPSEAEPAGVDAEIPLVHDREMAR